MDDEWDVAGAVVMECESCGEVRPCRLLDDPFVVEEIVEPHPEGDDSWLCRRCYRRMSDDV